MRRARSGDWWRRVYDRKFDPCLTRLAIRNVSGLGAGDIEFNGGITVICGSNGVGKSQVLSALHFAVSEEPAKDSYRGAQFEATIRRGPEEVKLSVTCGADGAVERNGVYPANVEYVDVSEQCAAMRVFFAEITNLDELLAAHSPRSDDARALDGISDLVGKRYTARDVFELDEYEERFGVLPYFRVAVDGFTYGSERMGLGELALHYLEWRLQQVPLGSLLLLEEPDAHVPPRSQLALLDLLAQKCTERSVVSILTSHSAAVIERVPPEHTLLLLRDGGNVRVVRNPSAAQLRAVLGVPHTPSGIVLVEDRCAMLFAREWLRENDPGMLHEFEIRHVGSDSEVLAAIDVFPPGAAWLDIFALLDGDVRDKWPEMSRARERAGKRDLLWPVAFLPGAVAPEKLLIAAARTAIEPLAEALRVPTTDVAVTIAALEGKDHHDWVEAFAEQLKLTYEQAISGLYRIWSRDDTNQGMSKAAFAELLRKFDNE